MIGQRKLLSVLETYLNNKTLPRTMLFEGTEGCGKHLVCSEIADKLSIPTEDITTKLSLETLENISLRPSPYIYIIDCSKISVREQNVILKFLEEPLKNSYIFLLCESKNRLLSTVINRCRCLSFESYTKEELKSFLKDNTNDEVLKYAETPGMVILLEDAPLKDMESLANQIYDKLTVASYSNSLRIPAKFFYKEEKEGLLNFDLFVNILIDVACDKYAENRISYSAYMLTRTFYNDCNIPHINKQQLFEHFIIELKMLFEGNA